MPTAFRVDHLIKLAVNTGDLPRQHTTATVQAQLCRAHSPLHWFTAPIARLHPTGSVMLQRWHNGSIYRCMGATQKIPLRDQRRRLLTARRLTSTPWCVRLDWVQRSRQRLPPVSSFSLRLPGIYNVNRSTMSNSFQGVMLTASGQNWGDNHCPILSWDGAIAGCTPSHWINSLGNRLDRRPDWITRLDAIRIDAPAG